MYFCLDIFLKVIYPLDGSKHRKLLFTAVSWMINWPPDVA